MSYDPLFIPLRLLEQAAWHTAGCSHRGFGFAVFWHTDGWAIGRFGVWA